MTEQGRRLLDLLPALYRLRDAELAAGMPALLDAADTAELAALEGAAGPLDPTEERRLAELRARRGRGPLGAFLEVIGEQVAVLEENLDQLYDDQFIETAAPWAVAYLGDLIGYIPLHELGHRQARRAEVAHTIAFRRRKGTASMLEQLARDVTGWHARVVEYFALLAVNQSLNHRRPGNTGFPSLRDGDGLVGLGGAFDALPRTLDVRRVERGRGRYNVPNIGIWLWRIDAVRLEDGPATPAEPAPARRFRFGPLGTDQPLYTRPVREDEISHLAEPVNVPEPIAARRLRRDLAAYYGPERSLLVVLDGVAVGADEIDVCNLSDAAGGWAHDPRPGRVAIDPTLGRLALAADRAAPADVRVTFHYGAVDEVAGGPYPRRDTFAMATTTTVRVPADQPTIQDALDALGGSGVVEIVDSGRYREALSIAVAADGAIELRAADGVRPTIELTAPLAITGGPGARAAINGLLIAGDALEVPAVAGNELRGLTIAHTTLVPGRSLAPDGTPASPGAASVVVAVPNLALAVDRSFTGALRVAPGSRASVTEGIVDAGAGGIAYAADDAGAPGGPLATGSATLVGRVATAVLEGSDSIFLDVVTVVRRQEGCLRFSYAPAASVVPRRYRCQPGDGEAAANVPHMASLRFGTPHYGRLADSTPEAIARGAEDESEMGAFGWRHEPQRHADLRARLDEYLRVGLAAGIFHAS